MEDKQIDSKIENAPVLEAPEGLDTSNVKAPKKDTRVKTDDVTGTKGLNWTSFGLSQDVQLGIYEKGFANPSPIQEESIPEALKGNNIIARAKNGTGKTASYSIPMVERIDTSKKHIQGLILVPIRELALQVSQVIKELGKHKKIEVMVSTGGNPVKEDIFRLYQTVHIIVATPGRILDLSSRGVAKLDQCNMVVLDEVDKLLSENFKMLVGKILDIMPEKKQVSLFSATYPVMIRPFQQQYVPNPTFINLMVELTLKGVTQFYAYLEEKEKLHCLNTLFSKLDINQAIIFCESAKRVELLAKKIAQLGYSCFYIHSKMQQTDRNK